MDAKGPVKLSDQLRGQAADPFAYPFDCYRADLFGLCFGVAGQPGLAGWQQHLERVDASGIGGHRHNGDHSAPETGRGRIGGVVADDHRWPGFGSLRPPCRVQADRDDLAAPHSVSQAVSDGSFPGAGIS